MQSLTQPAPYIVVQESLKKHKLFISLFCTNMFLAIKYPQMPLTINSKLSYRKQPSIKLGLKCSFFFTKHNYMKPLIESSKQDFVFKKHFYLTTSEPY